MSTEPLMTCLGLPGHARDGAVATKQLSVTITSTLCWYWVGTEEWAGDVVMGAQCPGFYCLDREDAGNNIRTGDTQGQ